MHAHPARRLGGAIALLVALAPVSRALSAGPAAPIPRREAPPIVGIVRDSTGRPLADVQVVIATLNRVAVTNETGRFAFGGVPAGSYHLRAILLGFAPGHADVTVPESGTPVEVAITMGSAPAVRLSSVQVTATPTGTDPRDVAQSTTEISPEQLARTMTTSIAQTLSREPGISVRYNGPAAAAPVIRGLTGERVLVLQDGQRTGDLSSTSSDHAVSIDPLTAERIEVVRGPASLLYGNNALGGVVNVIANDLPTAIHDHTDGYVNAQSESATPGGGIAAGVTIPLSGTLGLVLRGEGRHTDDLRMGGGGTLANSYSRNAAGGAGLGYVGTTANGGLLYRATAFDYGLPSADNDGAHIEGQRHEIVGRSEIGSAVGPFTSFRLGGTAQWYGHDEVERTGAVGTSFSLRTQTLDLLGRTHWRALQGAVGASALLRQYEATGEEALTPAANSNGAGIFVYQEVPLRPAAEIDARVPQLQLGARYDLYRITSRAGDPKFRPGRSRSFNNVSGSVGLSLPVRAGVTLAVSAARAFRAPTVEELYSNAEHHALGTYDIGEPSLVSETNQGVDGIVRVELPRVTAQLSSYYNLIDDFITSRVVRDTTLVGVGGTTEAVPLNVYTQADAKLRGVEGRVEVEVVPRAVLGAMGDVVRGHFRASGAPLPYLPAARLGGLVRYDNGRIAAEAEYRHAFRQRDVPPALTASDPAAVVSDPYDLVDLSFGYSFARGAQRSSVTLRVDNLLDDQYRDATSRIKSFAFNPGRSAALVVRTQF